MQIWSLRIWAHTWRRQPNGFRNCSSFVFDSESYAYGYSFSQALLDEWDLTEHFSPQTETEPALTEADSRPEAVAAGGYRELEMG